MIFKRLVLENFKSFTRGHTFDLSHSPGLYFLTGHNYAEPDLDRNGTGKTTIWDALHWCLYGKTLRNLKAGNVRTWGVQSPCSVKVSLIGDNGLEYDIERQYSPNRLVIDYGNDDNGRDVEQSTVDDIIGLTSEEFQNSIVIGQFSTMFFDLQPMPKLQLFSEILDLGFWADRSEESNKDARKVGREVVEVNEQLADLVGRFEELEDQLTEYEGYREDFEEQQQAKLDEFDATVNDLKRKVKKKTSHLKTLTNEMFEHDKKGGEIRNKISVVANKIGAVDSEYRTNESEVRPLQSQIDAVYKDVKRFDEVEGVCPYCFQEVDESHIESELDKLTRKKNKLEKQIQSVMAIVLKASKKITKLGAERKEFEEDLSEWEQVRSEISDETNHLKDDLGRREHDLANCLDSIKEEEARINPYAEMIKNAKVRLKDLDNDIGKLENKITELEKRQQALQFWVQGFKNIRLLIVRECLDHLEIEVNNSLLQLGLHDWTIRFDIERETTSGTISKGFQVMIRSPHTYGDKYVPWEVWSGGESQRLRLAGTMGLANLILERKGISSNIEVFDEPSTHMGAVSDLLNTLYQRAQDQDKQIWLVDHHAIDFGGFAAVVDIIKDGHSSKITWQS